jgi:hypothetical protein
MLPPDKDFNYQLHLETKDPFVIRGDEPTIMHDKRNVVVGLG